MHQMIAGHMAYMHLHVGFVMCSLRHDLLVGTGHSFIKNRLYAEGAELPDCCTCASPAHHSAHCRLPEWLADWLGILQVCWLCVRPQAGVQQICLSLWSVMHNHAHNLSSTATLAIT